MKQSMAVIAVIALCGMSFGVPRIASAADQEPDTSISDELLTDQEPENGQEQSQLDEEESSETGSEEGSSEMSGQNPETESEDLPETKEEQTQEMPAGSEANTEYTHTEEQENLSESEENAETLVESEIDTISTETQEETMESETEELLQADREEVLSLRIPQRVDIVIDPWEMDGKEQVYSEQYTIANTGKTKGILTLSNLVCTAGEQGGVIVKTDRNGVHDGQEKSIYMEMVFDNGDQIVFTQEGATYEIALKPGEEFAFWFTGEANENAFQPWSNGDIEVTIEYTWDTEEMVTEEADIEETGTEEMSDQVTGTEEESTDKTDVEETTTEESESDIEETNFEEITNEIQTDTVETGVEKIITEEITTKDIDTKETDTED